MYLLSSAVGFLGLSHDEEEVEGRILKRQQVSCCWRSMNCFMKLSLILGTVKSEGSFEIFTICGLFGNFSKILKRKGSFSLVSAFASLCFSCLSFFRSSSSSKLSKITATNKLRRIKVAKR